MSTSHAKLTETAKFDHAVVNADITTDRESSFVSAEGFNEFVGSLITGAAGAGSVATVQLLQAKNDSGGDKKPLTDVVSATAPDGGGALSVQAQAWQDQLDVANGFTHVAVKVTSNNSVALIGAATLVRNIATYRPV
jgi:hypothetical protein